MHYPKISVITPTRNVEKTFEKAADSLVNQNYPNLEWLIFDGKSTDKTLQLIQKYAPYITYWHSEPDNGPNYNLGIQKATGDILCFLNADDWYENNILFDVAAAFIENPELEIASCLTRAFMQKNNEISTLFDLKSQQLQLKLENMLNIPAVNAHFFSKTVFQKYGYFPFYDNQGQMNFGNDKIYLTHLTFKNIKQKVISKVGYTYFASDQSLTFGGKNSTAIRSHQETITLINTLFNDYSLTSQQKKLLRKIWLKSAFKYLVRCAFSRQLLKACPIVWQHLPF